MSKGQVIYVSITRFNEAMLPSELNNAVGICTAVKFTNLKVKANAANLRHGLTGSKCSWKRILLRTKVPGNESPRAISLLGAKVPGSERARERNGQGVNGPESESSRKQIGQGPIG